VFYSHGLVNCGKAGSLRCGHQVTDALSVGFEPKLRRVVVGLLGGLGCPGDSLTRPPGGQGRPTSIMATNHERAHAVTLPAKRDALANLRRYRLRPPCQANLELR
jgi:hypothetical protein